MGFFNAEDAEITQRAQRAQRFISYFLCVPGANSAFSAFISYYLVKYSPFQER